MRDKGLIDDLTIQPATEAAMHQGTTTINAEDLFGDFLKVPKLQNSKESFERYWEWPDGLGNGFMYVTNFRPGLILGMGDYRDLKKELPVSLHPVAEEWFKQRTQYQISLSHASMKDNIIILEISAARGILDSIGNLTEKPIASLLEVGFLDGKGELIETKKIRIKSGAHTYNLHSSFKPDKVILDPYYWYLIGNRKKSLRQLEF